MADRSDGPTVRLSDRPTVDSILPLDEEIRRFRLAVPEVPAALTGGERTRDALVRRWVTALESRDSTDLGRMLLNAAEYITFFYPESPYSRAPYRQAPGIRWGLMMSTSSQGAGRVWQRHAGQSLGFGGYQCDAEPEVLGRNQIWKNCVVTLQGTAGARAIRLFGPIIERDGEFKFLTYGSDY